MPLNVHCPCLPSLKLQHAEPADVFGEQFNRYLETAAGGSCDSLIDRPHSRAEVIKCTLPFFDRVSEQGCCHLQRTASVSSDTVKERRSPETLLDSVLDAQYRMQVVSGIVGEPWLLEWLISPMSGGLSCRLDSAELQGGETLLLDELQRIVSGVCA